MPWRECNVMDERVKFVARYLEGEKTVLLCRNFDISRKTGYKIIERYRDTGLEGLFIVATSLKVLCSEMALICSRMLPASAEL